ncbi:54S ribosomal protein L25, mitochondrial [Tulasnella sp. 424]|nr:54S ribosomal protein L25, mitochondrial [Tulasnella sp. 424]KAG8973975.1 54S ribosomal protein L25, mitochondrial [Tulasnella sp. 425]
MSTSTSLVRRFRARELGHVLASSSPSSTTAATPKLLQNPFLPRKNPTTGRWIPPAYSLRRQADLVKEAKRDGLVHLLPHGPKSPKAGQVREIVVKNERTLKTSPVLQALLNARKETGAHSSAKELEQVDAAGVKWVGKEPYSTHKPSFGLYGKRRKMFKGRKWERQVQLRKEYMEKVVDGLDKQKANMRWGRARKSKKPRSKYPI